MPWKSDRQRRWAHATGQPWAKDWDNKYATGGDVRQRRRQDKMNRYGQRVAQSGVLGTVADFIPIVGDLKGAKELWDEIQKPQPNWPLIGALGGATVIGLIPGVGDAAAAAIKTGARKGLRAVEGGLDVIKRLDIDPNTVGSLGGNIKLKPNAVKAHDAWEQQITKAYADLRANPSSANRAKVDELLKVEPEFPPEKVGTADYLESGRPKSTTRTPFEDWEYSDLQARNKHWIDFDKSDFTKSPPKIVTDKDGYKKWLADNPKPSISEFDNPSRYEAADTAKALKEFETIKAQDALWETNKPVFRKGINDYNKWRRANPKASLDEVEQQFNSHMKEYLDTRQKAGLSTTPDTSADGRFSIGALKMDESGKLYRDNAESLGWNYRGLPDDQWTGRATRVSNRANQPSFTTKDDRFTAGAFRDGQPIIGNLERDWTKSDRAGWSQAPDFEEAEQLGLIKTKKTLGFQKVKKRFDEWIKQNPTKSADDFFRVFDESDQGKSGQFIIPKSVRDSLKGSQFARGGMIY